MTWLFENPTPIIACGILVEAVLGIVLLRTGRGVLLWVMLGVAALVGLGVLVERLVVTEREEVEGAIEGAAAAVDRNDLEAALRYVAADARDVQSLLRFGMQRAEFERVKISRLEIRVIHTTSPPTAKADIGGFVQFHDRRGEYPYGTYPIDGTLELRREGKDWVVTGYTLKQDPRK